MLYMYVFRQKLAARRAAELTNEKTFENVHFIIIKTFHTIDNYS